MATQQQHNGSGHGAAFIGVALMCLVALINAFDAVLVRTISQDIHPVVIGFTRSLFGLLAVFPWIISRRDILKSSYRAMHVLRALFKLGALVAFFTAFAYAPLADVTAIAFATPVFVTIGAWAFLKERPPVKRLIAAALGFCGVLIVLRPGEFDITLTLGLALVGALLTALIQLMLKVMSRKDSTETLVAWNLILTAPLALLPALWFWTEPTFSQWGILAFQGVLGAANMAAVTRAMALADASLIAPIDFLRLPLVAIMAFLFFGETVGVPTWIGAGVIFAATLLVASTAGSKNYNSFSSTPGGAR